MLNRIHLDGDQVAASKQERAQRLINVFSINPDKIDLIQNKNIVLIDDVMTTGATLSVVQNYLKILERKVFIIGSFLEHRINHHAKYRSC